MTVRPVLPASLGRYGALGVGVALLAACLCIRGGRAAEPLPPITVVLDGSGGGKVFDGIGATSGGGASSRLLFNYPEPQRSEILDYLFKPNYGAALQMLKVEIGSGGNSGMGSETTYARRAGDENFTRGYEWWLMQEARRRNPSIKLLALAWNFPAWLGAANSQATANYLAGFIAGARRAYGLDIDYIGIWNETPMDAGFIKRLRITLDASHLKTRVIADDLVNDWSIVDKMAADPQLRADVDVIATHYPRTTSPKVVRERASAWGKPLWSSEDGPWDDAWGALGSQSTPLAELLNRNYIRAGITSTNVWNLATGYYDILDYTNAGLMRANTPWSGHYELTSPLWVVAHTTQFAQPGWRYLDAGSALLPGGGSYVTLHDGPQYSVVAETISAQQPQILHFQLRGGLAESAVHVWRSSAGRFLQKISSVVPKSGQFEVRLEPGSVYSLTTTTGQGRGAAQSPPARPFPLPYREDFEAYPIGTDAVKFFAEQNGAFEVGACPAGRPGQCLNQVAVAPPIWWTYGADAKRLGTPSVIGDPRWRDYRVSADVLVSGDGYAGILGRVSRALCCDGTLSAYQFRVNGSGQWELAAASQGAVLATGKAPASAGAWRHLELAMQGEQVSASIDGVRVLFLTDERHGSGLAGIVGGWNPESYDNFRIEPVAPRVPVVSAPTRHASNTPPDPPKLLVPIATRNAVRLAWSSVPGATGYRIRFGEGDGPLERTINVGSSTSYTVTTLTNGVRYRFQVLAVSAGGEGRPSDEQTATPAESE